MGGARLLHAPAGDGKQQAVLRIERKLLSLTGGDRRDLFGQWQRCLEKSAGGDFAWHRYDALERGIFRSA